MCSNAYDDVKDFEVCEFIKNTDLNSFRSRVFLKVVFSTNKKTIHYPFRALVMVKNGFLAEVTFNNDIQLRRIAFEY